MNSHALRVDDLMSDSSTHIKILDKKIRELQALNKKYIDSSGSLFDQLLRDIHIPPVPTPWTTPIEMLLAEGILQQVEMQLNALLELNTCLSKGSSMIVNAAKKG